jgi:hypothetical protein
VRRPNPYRAVLLGVLLMGSTGCLSQCGRSGGSEKRPHDNRPAQTASGRATRNLETPAAGPVTYAEGDHELVGSEAFFLRLVGAIDLPPVTGRQRFLLEVNGRTLELPDPQSERPWVELVPAREFVLDLGVHSFETDGSRWHLVAGTQTPEVLTPSAFGDMSHSARSVDLQKTKPRPVEATKTSSQQQRGQPQAGQPSGGPRPRGQPGGVITLHLLRVPRAEAGDEDSRAVISRLYGAFLDAPAPTDPAGATDLARSLLAAREAGLAEARVSTHCHLRQKLPGLGERAAELAALAEQVAGRDFQVPPKLRDALGAARRAIAADPGLFPRELELGAVLDRAETALSLELVATTAGAQAALPTLRSAHYALDRCLADPAWDRLLRAPPASPPPSDTQPASDEQPASDPQPASDVGEVTTVEPGAIPPPSAAELERRERDRRSLELMHGHLVEAWESLQRQMTDADRVIRGWESLALLQTSLGHSVRKAQR